MNSHRFSRTVLKVLCLWGAGVAAAPAPAVPPKQQAAMFKKIASYDRALRGAASLEVVVLAVDPATPVVAEVVSAMTEVGYRARGAKPEAELKQVPAGPTLLYVMPGAQSPELKAYAEKHRLLTFAGSVELVMSADAAVGLAARPGGAPQVLIHLGRVKACGHEFSSELLALAKVVP